MPSITDIKIIDGLVSRLRGSSRHGFYFLIGDPPVAAYIRVPTWQRAPFSSNEYVAIAARQRWFLPSSYVVLAYRVGLKAPTRLASIAGPIAAILVAAVGLALLVLTPAHPNGGIVAVLAVCWGLVGIFRLRRALAAKRLLTDWEPSGQDFEAKPSLP
jgi:hypothetical protein